MAKLLGYKNFGRGIHVIEQIESGRIHEPVTKIIELLKITQAELKFCFNEETRLENECRAALPPFRPHIVRRFTACAYGRISIPDHIKPSELLNYASDLARKLKSELCLRLNYNLCYWVGIDGKCKKESNPDPRPQSTISFEGEAK
jgi:hypothetical protein